MRELVLLATCLKRNVAFLLGAALLSGCSCLKSHDRLGNLSQYTPGLDVTPAVRMEELGILMRFNDGFRVRNQTKMSAELLEEAMRARESGCSKEEFDAQVKVFNEVINRRIEGYKREHDIYVGWLVPCVSPQVENQQKTNSHGAMR
jgi:hypothetical protein